MFYNTGNKLKNSRFHTPHINQFMTEVKHSLNDHKHIRGLLKGAKLAPLSQGSYNSNDCGIKSQIQPGNSPVISVKGTNLTSFPNRHMPRSIHISQLSVLKDRNIL